MTKIHRDKNDSTHEFAKSEFNIMSAQLDLEMEKKISTWNALKVPSVRKRFMLGFLAMMGTQCSGLVVILGTYSCLVKCRYWNYLILIRSVLFYHLCRSWLQPVYDQCNGWNMDYFQWRGQLSWSARCRQSG